MHPSEATSQCPPALDELISVLARQMQLLEAGRLAEMDALNDEVKRLLDEARREARSHRPDAEAIRSVENLRRRLALSIAQRLSDARDGLDRSRRGRNTLKAYSQA